MASDGDQHKDPFQDPTAPSVGSSSSSAELHVERGAYLSLTNDSLLVHGSSSVQAIPYYNVLNARLNGLEITIVHALPTSKKSVRPAYISYSLADKTASPAATTWIERLLSLAYRGATRSKRLKVLINPHGGPGLAPKLYAKDAEPIFKAAGCEIEAMTTDYVGHAIDIARTLDVDKFDAVVCCSGDGTPHEVFNGLAQQPRPRRALRKIAVTQIPGGSGNALSLNVNGTNKPSLAALAIVKAVRTPIDLVSITQGQRRYFSCLSQAVGIIAESDLDTEEYRWMGAHRFTYGFLVRMFGKTVYPAEVSILVEHGDKNAIRAAYKKARYNNAEGSEADVDRAREIHDDETELPPSAYGTVNDPLPADWSTTDMPDLGNFYVGNMVHMSPDTPFFSAALPNDGLMDLTMAKGTTSRTKLLKMMLDVADNRLFNHDILDYRKVKAYRISPRLRPGQKEGFISIDGEKVEFTPFQAEVVHSLGTVLSAAGKVYHCDGPRDS
ncbi:hypothetical protein ANO11243_057430 [Dothideomycetidae sp. 11243]|nr:hypothetical protein ANO11243_057430 [fungal sp. No.11243]